MRQAPKLAATALAAAAIASMSVLSSTTTAYADPVFPPDVNDLVVTGADDVSETTGYLTSLAMKCWDVDPEIDFPVIGDQVLEYCPPWTP